MIVKNESDVIARCLRSVASHINSWCIVDTGSVDGTQEIIQGELNGLPGALHERPWSDDFAKARNEALDLALKHQAPSHLMFIDADEELEALGKIPLSGWDALLIPVEHCGQPGDRFWMIRADYAGRWVGARHEDMQPSGRIAKLADSRIISHTDGARAKDASTAQGDLRALLMAVQADPSVSRNWHYLGMTFAQVGDFAQAEKAFSVRAQMDGDPREIEITQAFLNQLQGATQC